jgi:hypothetical protein
MRKIVPALAAAFIATVGVGSAAQAAVINFGAVALCAGLPTCTGISYTGPTLALSTSLDLDGSNWIVTIPKAGDVSGLKTGDGFTLTPTSGSYGTLHGIVDLPLPHDLFKVWTATIGPDAGDTFIETLTTLHEINRGVRDLISFTFEGTITTAPADSGVLGAPVELALSLTQAGGPGNITTATLTNVSSAIPEPSTWVMLALGFIGLGYAAVRRGSKDKAALAI